MTTFLVCFGLRSDTCSFTLCSFDLSLHVVLTHVNVFVIDFVLTQIGPLVRFNFRSSLSDFDLVFVFLFAGCFAECVCLS